MSIGGGTALRHRHTAIWLPVLGLALAACEGDNLFSTTILTEETSYRATSVTLTGQGGIVLDLVPLGGAFELTLDHRDNTFSSSFDYLETHAEVQGDFERTDTGIEFSDDPFRADNVVTPRTFGYQDEDDVVVLTGSTSGFDVDEDGVPDTVDIRVVLVQI